MMNHHLSLHPYTTKGWLFWLQLLLFCVVVPATAFAQSIDLTAEEQAYLDANPVFRVQDGKDWPPFNYNEYGEVKGFSNDYIRLIAKKLGVEVEFVAAKDFKAHLEMMRSHQLDLHTNLNRTPDREKEILFSERSMLDIHDGLLFKESGPHYQNLDDLYGRTVAVVRGYFHEELIRRHHPQIQLLLVNSPLELVRSVVYGRADAAIESLPVFNFHISRYFFSGLKSQPLFYSELFGISKQYIGIRSDRPILKRIIDKAMAVLTDKERAVLHERWMIVPGNTRHSTIKSDLSFTESYYLKNQKGRLTYCAAVNRMPFEGGTAGEHIGISVDLMKFLQQQINIPFELKPSAHWDASLKSIEQRQCDLAVVASIHEEGMAGTTLSRPFLESPIALATRMETPFFEDLSTLNGERIGMLKGDRLIETIRSEHPSIELVEFELIDHALDQVIKGELDGYIDSLLALSYEIQNYPLELKINGKLDHSMKLHLASRDDEPLLAAIIEKSLDSIDLNMQQKMITDWISVRYQKDVNYSTLIQVVSVAIAILLILFYRQQILKRHELELRENVISLNDAMRQAQLIMKEQNNFISMISHEISNPLASINASVDLIDLYSDPQQQEVHKELERVARTVSRLSELVDGMIVDEWIEATSGEEWVHDKMELSPILQQLVEEYEVTWQQDAATPSLFVEGNPTLLSIALSNLLSNGCKFANSPEAVVMRVIQTDKRTVHITIEDDGPGIPPAERERVFEKFYRSSHGREKTGSGLGLYIVQKIIDFHRGNIEVDEAPSGGAQFNITLPVARNGGSADG